MEFIQIDKSILPQIAHEYGEKAARHLHFDDGFTLAALNDGQVVGFASFVWRDLIAPLESLQECFIDIIETKTEYRRQGIASSLLEMAEQYARDKGVYQLRAWSSDNKIEALPMWAALHFGLSPAVVYPGGQEVHGYFVTKSL